ncbi:LLM class flavin-dependent oxidoreductase [Pseudonocardia alaniniphila]|uniref:LLM class flavin-dependent oxidoreductase n=1 Tax=Pseudonocardia alaniniphila TaxID=75291 RepID=A0ABS9TU36_9PSEU|nr:LLM class flavin-dependent oxidoreductase [Pseudonocardia alaniniphila]MCH6172060.1 LLM class flavin-dependent oxidoreductase [Pseudonocardia alaniniphila]
MKSDHKMRLAAYYNPTGHHVASWRHPRAEADAPTNIKHYVDIARTAERAKFDLIFLADGNAMREANMEALCRSVQFVAHFEPLTLLSALAMVTEKIGLVATASTSWNAPYHIARKFASLDHISGGRAGWNIVTSQQDAEARNFSQEHAYEHADRYDRAREVVKIVLGLWDSWDDDAFVCNKDSGIYFDPTKVHILNHKSERYRVRGPLNVPRPLQGYPLLVQAGGSNDGRETAAQFAEATFSPHLNISDAKEYYDDVKRRMVKYGRDPEHMKILPGLSVIVRSTEKEANADFELLQSFIHPMVAREILSTMLGEIDLSGYSFDEPLPDLPDNDSGHYVSILAMARKENLTIRQLGMRVAGARGKNVIKGTPDQVVDYMEEWFLKGACDGFTIMPPYIPGALDDFCELVVPELQRRGLFRTEYEGRTLREHLGIPRPASQYASRRSRAAE